ncbi:hypothetical protein GCM10020360_26580 [Nonlabens tegetincola]
MAVSAAALGAASEPVPAASVSPALNALGLAGVAAGLIGTGLVIRGVALSSFHLGVMISLLSLLIFLLGLAALHLVLDARPNRVRYIANEPFVWFSQARVLPLTVAWGTAVLATAIAIFSFLSIATGLLDGAGNALREVSPLAWVLAFVCSIATWFAWREVVRAHRSPLGVQLRPNGISFVTGQAAVMLSWQQLDDVIADTVRKHPGAQSRQLPCVRVETESGRSYAIKAIELGSDPNVVAAFIRYYRDNPRERERLVDPATAISHFSEAQETR